MKLTIGFSPCPNDTFIFDALINNKIDTQGLSFDLVMKDVQTLNEMALDGKLDIVKISYGNLPLVLDNYVLLNSGGALGKGVGPLLVSRVDLPDVAINQCLVAIPGKHTTANVLFSLAYPEAVNKVFLKYNEIEDFTLSGPDSLEQIQAVRLGVIIHENRFTYQDKGLLKLKDLGSFWETETGYPVPLGGIVARRSIPASIKIKVDQLIRESLEFAYASSEELSDFVKENAMEMDTHVMQQHIDLYVNNFSLDLGRDGKEAVKKFIQVHSSINKIPVDFENMFL